ncbi:MAG: hypothetical protein A2W93_03295 [Bacteroidetes bacterium GWF2_43_63]|nr:MAG: hypothetical protein A2W94_09295 [Bacteroidetes bacterium GWE2_42_42]OFY53685.1 MAG: hypothetical protein A2W93_03295 [Bacteroidetes bacterium GWF2_43_63]HBG70969.1 hypothetical protein [Bacteroidales bacterium]HCB62940.1 hypothetical protein [Bacteroidales bacterium]HCY24296.1 hypothetical protein [Bacteroidales bacterium]
MRTLLLAFFLVPLLSYSQNASTNSLSANYEKLTTEWQQMHDQNGILIYVKKSDCNRPQDGIFQEMILLKIINTTQYDLTISWDLLLWYNAELWTRLPVRPENNHQIVLMGGELLEGSCDNKSGYYSALMFFSRFLNYDDKPEMTKFELININISRYEK